MKRSAFTRPDGHFLQGTFRFWVATLVEKVLVVMLPIGRAAIPGIQIPARKTYDWMMQLRIRRSWLCT